MLYKKLVDITIEQYFMDKKNEIIDKYNKLLAVNIFSLDCNKEEITYYLNHILTQTLDKAYIKLLDNYKLNNISDFKLNYIVLTNNYLNSIHSCFKNNEDYEKIKPIIKDLMENFNYAVLSLYNVTLGHLIPTDNNAKQIS